MTTSPALENPEAFFADERWTLGVVGLGYVGLPLLVTAAERGLGAIGFDVSPEHVAMLEEGRSPVDDITDEALKAALASGTEVSTDPAVLARADAVMICVPSPLGRNRQPDLSYIEAAAETVRDIARPGQLISLESTTYPGTTEEYFVPAVAAAGLELDRDVWVAFSPERVSPGEELTTGTIPKVVGGVTPRSTAVAAAAYGRIAPRVHTVSSARAAEMTKLLENTYRAVNIALANEMAQLTDALDIDIWEVIEAAATKPFGFEPFWPGPGVGGHCIPLDPQYLAWRARESNFATRFIDLADQINSKMPRYNAERITDMLNRRGLAVHGSQILVVGAAYKPNVADARESASLDVIRDLVARGAVVSVIDPVVGSEGLQRLGLDPVEPDADLSRFALAAVLTDHDGIDYAAIAEAVPVVYDARGVYRRLGIEAPSVEVL